MPTGFLYFSDDGRQAQRIDLGTYFTDVLPSDPKIELLQVALLSFFGDAWDAAAVMTRGAKAATYKWRVRFEDFVEIEPPLSFSELRDHHPAMERLTTPESRARGIQLSATGWEAVRQALAELRPDVNLAPLEARAARIARPRELHDREPIAEYEGDAVNLALRAAGLDHIEAVHDWSGSDEAPYLSGLRDFGLLEDRMVEHDARVFGDWDLLRAGPVGVVEFQQHQRKLTVFNVNRAGVEHALGVDLVYFSHEFHAYVLVQYKRMTPRSQAKGFEYRPDAQLEKELDRLRKLPSPAGTPRKPRDFRLSSDAAFLKLCPSTTKEPFATSLIQGMYLPLDYWDALASSPETRGPRGGRIFTTDNVSRHINNTLFVSLLSDGWIGSRTVTTTQITRIIRSSLASDRSVVLAEAHQDPVPGRGQTR